MNPHHPQQPNTCPHRADIDICQHCNRPCEINDDAPDVDGLTPEQKQIADRIESAMWLERIEYAASFRQAGRRRRLPHLVSEIFTDN